MAALPEDELNRAKVLNSPIYYLRCVLILSLALRERWRATRHIDQYLSPPSSRMHKHLSALTFS